MKEREYTIQRYVEIKKEDKFWLIRCQNLKWCRGTKKEALLLAKEIREGGTPRPDR